MVERVWYIVRTNIQCEEKATKNLRRAGYRVHHIRMAKDIVHHRTKKVITKRFTLFNRYIFVGVDKANLDFWTLRQCDGVESVLGQNGRYLPVPRNTVCAFVGARRRLEFDDTKRARIKRGVEARTAKETAKLRFPLGQGAHVKNMKHPFGGFYGQVVSVKGKGKVTLMLELFAGLSPVEFDMKDLEPPAIDTFRPAA